MMKPSSTSEKSNRTHYLVHQFHISAREHAALARALNLTKDPVVGDWALCGDVLRYVLEKSSKEDQPAR